MGEDEWTLLWPHNLTGPHVSTSMSNNSSFLCFFRLVPSGKLSYVFKRCALDCN